MKATAGQTGCARKAVHGGTVRAGDGPVVGGTVLPASEFSLLFWNITVEEAEVMVL